MSSFGASNTLDPPSSSSSASRMAHVGKRSESISSGSDYKNSHHSNGSTGLMPPDQNRPRSSSSSKALLTMALLEAQSAVQLDNDNDISGALDAYQRAVNLLSKVMETSNSADEQERLRTIHDSYLFRIRLLSTPPTPTTPTNDSMTQSPTSPLPHSPISALPQSPISALPQSPPPQQPLPPLPRQPNPARTTGTVSSTLASITPASSSSNISSQQNGDDPSSLSSDGTQISGSVVQSTVSPARRIRKHVPVPIQPPASGSTIQPPTEPRTPRQRSDSTSTAEHGSSYGHVRHHTRSHTGGSTRITGDLIHAAEQLQIQAQHRVPGVPKVRSRDHLGVPIHSAPTAPLPPTPTLGQPPSSPPPVPMPSGFGSASSTPTHSNPSTPNMATTSTFSSLPSSPPPRAPLPPAPINLTSPPASPANNSRRISPLVPSSSSSSSQQQGSQKSFQSPPDSSPEEEKSNESAHSKFYDEDLVSDEWLPNLTSTGFSASETLEYSSEDPYPRERVTSKGSFTGSQLETRPKAAKRASAEHEGQSTVETPQQKQQQQQQQQQQQPAALQHQRSFSQSSNVSAHLSISSQTRSPLVAPMYSFQQGASSISSLHALDGSSHKRISDSSRSLKESSPLARSSGSPAATINGTGAASSPGQPTSRPSLLHHQHSSSKLSATLSNSSSASPTLDKTWSPSPSNSHANGPSGGMTLYDVITDDPFGNMTFPFPPPFVEQPPTDPYLRCFWLMRKLEQTMTTGGFLTKRMYVPRTIWYQSLVRLPAADSKMSACQTLNNLFSKLVKQSQSGHLNILVEGGPEVDAERMTILKELEALETAANQVQSKLSKKLSFVPRPGKNGLNLTIATNQSYSEDMQGPTTGGTASIYGAASIYGDSYNWSTGDEPPLPGNLGHEKSVKKGGVSVGGSGPDAGVGGLKSQWKSFSKSVQKSIGNDKVDDTSMYTEAVIRLFQSSYILESMLRHYAPSPYQLNIQISNRLRRLCDVLSQVICAFVVRDLGELMGKYVKRVGAWVAD
ncbi:hypothetical protein BGX21_010460 [Mortierella sp. AD011]|nr:hypothetical protein BGX20_007976 [Mortierella sp. AD010]KAF9402341.1 hypothetical protein BGX21_010460 [Mortierella sp. AD011]